MVNKDPTRTDSGILHSWSYVIIPMEGRERPLFSAYCKNCDTYITKWLNIPLNATDSMLGKVGVPKTGCSAPYAGIM